MASVRIDRNVRLSDVATGIQSSTDNEPTVASFLDTVMVTGNMYASHSTDNGATFTFVNPFTAFPPTAGGFCCDQIVIHERSRNLWLWVLQYRTNLSGSNIFRLAVSTSGGAPGSFSRYDFAPGQVDPAWATGVMFDRPDMATTNNHLYITFNVFTTTFDPNQFLAMVVFKIPLEQLAALQPLTWVFHRVNAPDGRAVALARGAGNEMFYAGNQLSGGDVRIFRWPDLPLNAGISQFDVSPATWVGGVRPSYSAPGPGGEWLSKHDARVTTGWVSGNQVGFMWTANRDAVRPQPYIKAIVVNTTTQALVAQPDIHNPSVAFAYPATCPNVNGTVAVSLFQGGGATDPMHIVGFMDAAGWILQGTIASTNAPIGGIWGDYLSCETHDPDGVDWVASGFTLQGGVSGQFLDPQYVRFGVNP
jgi:hypothetical protein